MRQLVLKLKWPRQKPIAGTPSIEQLEPAEGYYWKNPVRKKISCIWDRTYYQVDIHGKEPKL